MIQKGSIRARVLGGLAVVAIVAAACSSSGASTAAPGSGAARLVHDRLRQPRRRRQRLARGDDLLGQGPGRQVRQRPKVTVINHDTDAAGQLADIRDLIAQDVNAIIINPTDPDALNPAIDEAIAAGITVVAVDASSPPPGAYNLSNDQEQYAYLGAKCAVRADGRKGAVVYMRGIAGHPADTDRDTGFKRALAEYPGHQGRQGTSSPSGIRRPPSARSTTS